MKLTSLQNQAPAQPSITLDFKMATNLLEMFGGEPGLVILQYGGEHCHSGSGLYAWYSDRPEEGSEFLGAEQNDASLDSAMDAACKQGENHDRYAKEASMTDRELLEMAAKAAGYEIDGYSDRYGALVSEADGVSMWWSPLTNDEEALRLAVKLGIHITNNQSDAQATALGVTAIELLTNDPYAATRRAIVRAAAEIGAQIKRGHARSKQ